MPSTILDVEFRRILPREWKWIALRGALAVFFGLLVLIFPPAAVPLLAIMFGAFIFADGIVSFAVGWRMHKMSVPWWPYLVMGVTGVVIGVVAFIWPLLTALTLVYVVAAWAIFSGILQIVSAVRLRDVIDTEILLIITGVLSVIFGVLLVFLNPVQGAIILATMVGFFAVFYGALTLIFAWKLRKVHNAATDGPPAEPLV